MSSGYTVAISPSSTSVERLRVQLLATLLKEFVTSLVTPQLRGVAWQRVSFPWPPLCSDLPDPNVTALSKEQNLLITGFHAAAGG